MGLRIQNNIAALNAHRNLSISDSGLSKSLERLSSGFRINRAADDAAGLSVSQQFRADIASYKVASRNVSEANSLLQVAEGAMDQIGNMLTRLKELATQASSANASANLDKINAEGNALLAEIDRIANSTEYSGTKLLDGSFGVSVSAADSGFNAGSWFRLRLQDCRVRRNLHGRGVIKRCRSKRHHSFSHHRWALHQSDHIGVASPGAGETAR